MSAAWIVIIAALVACAAPTPSTRVVDPLERQRLEGHLHERRRQKSARRFGPPAAASEAWPWEIGQWVTYERRYGNRVSFEH